MTLKFHLPCQDWAAFSEQKYPENEDELDSQHKMALPHNSAQETYKPTINSQ